MAQSFDITEPLTKRLRGLLNEYPPGITVLRELLQNADDAGSRTVVRLPQKHSPTPHNSLSVSLIADSVTP